MPNDNGLSLSWHEIQDLCRSQLDPADIRRLDTQIWQTLLFQMASAEPPPVQLEKIGVSRLLRLSTRPQA